jgi:hypothetical protein
MKPIATIQCGVYLWMHFMVLTQNAPTTMLQNLISCENDLVEVAVVVSGFNNIGAFSLTMHYDSALLSFIGHSNNSGFPGLAVNEPSPGVIVAGGFTMNGSGFSIPDMDTFFTVSYSIANSSAMITWFENGPSCEYAGSAPMFPVLNDIPYDLYYQNGSIMILPPPGNAGFVAGPSGGSVCAGETNVVFSVDPVPNAMQYVWSLPQGAQVSGGFGTNIILVDFEDSAEDGFISVYAINDCGYGSVSPEFQVWIQHAPEVIVQPQSPDPVNAGDGTAIFSVLASGSALSYEWQQMTDAWYDITDDNIYSGSATADLIITNPPYEMNSRHYRCIMSGFCEPETVTDGQAVLTVIPLTSPAPELEAIQEVAGRVALSVNPNPVRDNATIGVRLYHEGHLMVDMLSLTGEKILNIANIQLNAGLYHFELGGKLPECGNYLIIAQLTGNNLKDTVIKKLIVVQ